MKKFFRWLWRSDHRLLTGFVTLCMVLELLPTQALATALGEQPSEAAPLEEVAAPEESGVVQEDAATQEPAAEEVTPAEEQQPEVVVEEKAEWIEDEPEIVPGDEEPAAFEKDDEDEPEKVPEE